LLNPGTIDHHNNEWPHSETDTCVETNHDYLRGSEVTHRMRDLVCQKHLYAKYNCVIITTQHDRRAVLVPLIRSKQDD